jgi:hypothetical protein
MAQAVVFTVNAFPYGVDSTLADQIIYGKVTFTGSGGYTTNGIPTSNFSLVNGDGSRFQPNVSTSQPKPFVVYFQNMDSSLNVYQYDSVNDKFFATTAGVQVGSGVALSGLITFEAHYAKGA